LSACRCFPRDPADNWFSKIVAHATAIRTDGASRLYEPSGRLSCVKPVGGPSMPVQPPSTNSVLPLTKLACGIRGQIGDSGHDLVGIAPAIEDGMGGVNGRSPTTRPGIVIDTSSRTHSVALKISAASPHGMINWAGISYLL
jgi:hypothetical protein